MVYLDVSHIPAEVLNRKIEGILEIYEKFVGDDPRKVPMKIFPGMHYTMGGLWVDFNQMTNIPGVYAAGEADYSIHGANRLGANSLLSDAPAIEWEEVDTQYIVPRARRYDAAA